MASGNFIFQWHGAGGDIPLYDHEAPDMYVTVKYNISRSSTNRNTISGSVTASLNGLGGYSYFGYNIVCKAKIVEDSAEAKQVFSKPNLPNRWNSGVYKGTVNFSFTDTTHSTIRVRLYFDSNCPCTGGTNYYQFSINVGDPYTTPNIIITSINGVSIAEGSGKYKINLNGNQNITIGYSAWSNSINNDKCSINAWIKPYDRNKANLSYKTIKNDGNGKPAGSALYRKYNVSSDPATLIGSGVPFSYDGDQVWLYVQRHHTETSKNSAEKLHSNVRLIKVLYTPIKSVTFTKQPIGLYESKQSVDVSWTYPTPPSLIDQYGIVSGYEIRLINKDTGETEFTATTATTNYSLGSDKYKPLTKYYLQVLPYYLNGSSKSYGPSKNSNEFMLITKLNPPTISYPNTGTNCTWIGNKLYLLAQLPYDSDSEYIDGYLYKDLEVTVNSTSYKFSSNPEMFSIGNLSHNAKFVFTTKNINIPFASNYVIKTRVQKNYTFNGEYKWSDYSSVELSSVQVPSIPTYSGYILASHYNDISKYIKGMRNCYIEPNDSVLTSDVAVRQQINRSDFQHIFNDLNGISQLIDQWGEYSNDIKVKFSDNNSFSPKIEYITDLKNDTNPVGNNYFILSFEWIRYYG